MLLAEQWLAASAVRERRQGLRSCSVMVGAVQRRPPFDEYVHSGHTARSRAAPCRTALAQRTCQRYSSGASLFARAASSLRQRTGVARGTTAIAMLDDPRASSGDSGAARTSTIMRSHIPGRNAPRAPSFSEALVVKERSNVRGVGVRMRRLGLQNRRRSLRPTRRHSATRGACGRGQEKRPQPVEDLVRDDAPLDHAAQAGARSGRAAGPVSMVRDRPFWRSETGRGALVRSSGRRP